MTHVQGAIHAVGVCGVVTYVKQQIIAITEVVKAITIITIS